MVGTNALITAENPNSGGTTYVEDIDVTKGTQVGSTITLPGAPVGTPQVVGNDVLITTDNPSTGAGGTTYVADINATTGAKLGSTILLGAGSSGPAEVVGTNALITAENPNSGGTTYVEDIDVTKGTQVGSTISLPARRWAHRRWSATTS